jgi:hypothetical protein
VGAKALFALILQSWEVLEVKLVPKILEKVLGENDSAARDGNPEPPSRF